MFTLEHWTCLKTVSVWNKTIIKSSKTLYYLIHENIFFIIILLYSCSPEKCFFYNSYCFEKMLLFSLCQSKPQALKRFITKSK